MTQQSIRPPAVAGSWYPGRPDTLGRAIDEHLRRVVEPPAGTTVTFVGLIAPHAGLMYSGPVAAYAYRAIAGRSFDVVVLVGPSHYVGFEGVSIWPGGAFDTPLGPLTVSEVHAAALQRASPVIHPYPAAHQREHSLEMQLPFLKRVLPGVPIVPLVMGYQERDTILSLAEALGSVLRNIRALVIASTDLSHYFPATQAAELDGRTVAYIQRFDEEGLLGEFEHYPEHERGRFVACGGGPAIAVMKAARMLGAAEARALKYADSGDVSGDKAAVVGYLAAAFGTFGAAA